MSRLTNITYLSLLAAAAVGACKSSSDGPDYTPPAVATPSGAQPTFGTIVSADTPPPPISGGTLAVAPDGRTVVAADPDRDRVYVIDVPARTVTHDVKLAARSEPGRVAIDTHGRAHVALRSSGNVATVDLATGATTEQHVCLAPRGIAFDEQMDAVHVACADGVLVTLPLDGSAPRRVELDMDLRDVVVQKSRILVSRFRSADVLVLNRTTGLFESKSETHGGNLGWRMIAPPKDDTTGDSPDQDPAMVSQDPVNPVGRVPQGYYGTPALDACVASTITKARLDLPGRTQPIFVPPAVLPVDMATNGHEYALVAAGNGHTPSLPQIFITSARAPDPTTNDPYGASSSGSPYGYSPYAAANPDCAAMVKGWVPGQAIAVAYDGNDELLVQSREPAALYVMSPDRQHVWKEIRLSDESREDTGHAIFHSNSGGFLACASCHAEGAEDGRTWTFLEGQRRTPSLRGTLHQNGPFHWDGSMVDLRDLVEHIFVTRMSGPELQDAHVETLKGWLFKIPPPPNLERPLDQVQRGNAIFVDRCAKCHQGAALTNYTTQNVGTGGTFKVPSLVGVRWRAPFLHNGCATTLKDRFGPCGGAQHGDLSGLAPAQIDDLVTFLETL